MLRKTAAINKAYIRVCKTLKKVIAVTMKTLKNASNVTLFLLQATLSYLQ